MRFVFISETPSSKIPTFRQIMYVSSFVFPFGSLYAYFIFLFRIAVSLIFHPFSSCFWLHTFYVLIRTILFFLRSFISYFFRFFSFFYFQFFAPRPFAKHAFCFINPGFAVQSLLIVSGVWECPFAGGAHICTSKLACELGARVYHTYYILGI